MLRNRKGVTLFELMTVVVIAGVMMLVALPRMSESRKSAGMSSARTQVESYLATARAVAIRNGGKTQLVRYGNTLMIQADTGTGWVTVVRPVELGAKNISITPSVNAMAFDARGLATGLNATGEKFYIQIASGYGAGTKDSVCITRFGAVLDRKCGQPAPAGDVLLNPEPLPGGGGGLPLTPE